MKFLRASVCGIIFALLLIFAPKVFAEDSQPEAEIQKTATIMVDAQATGELKSGEFFKASFVVDGGSQKFDTFQSTVVLSGLSLVDVVSSDSIYFTQRPTVADLSFSGQVLEAQDRVTVFEATLQKVDNGKASISFADSDVTFTESDLPVSIFKEAKTTNLIPQSLSEALLKLDLSNKIVATMFTLLAIIVITLALLILAKMGKLTLTRRTAAVLVAAVGVFTAGGMYIIQNDDLHFKADSSRNIPRSVKILNKGDAYTMTKLVAQIDWGAGSTNMWNDNVASEEVMINGKQVQNTRVGTTSRIWRFYHLSSDYTNLPVGKTFTLSTRVKFSNGKTMESDTVTLTKRADPYIKLNNKGMVTLNSVFDYEIVAEDPDLVAYLKEGLNQCTFYEGKPQRIASAKNFTVTNCQSGIKFSELLSGPASNAIIKWKPFLADQASEDSFKRLNGITWSEYIQELSKNASALGARGRANPTEVQSTTFDKFLAIWQPLIGNKVAEDSFLQTNGKTLTQFISDYEAKNGASGRKSLSSFDDNQPFYIRFWFDPSKATSSAAKSAAARLQAKSGDIGGASWMEQYSVLAKGTKEDPAYKVPSWSNSWYLAK